VARFGPRVVYSASDRLRAQAQARWAAITGGVVPTLLPEGLPTAPDRIDFDLDLSYRLRSRANLTLSWSGHQPKGGELVHTARGELRAFFE
jgi:hypothetical protein